MAGRSMRVIFVPDGGAPIRGTLVEEPPGTWGGGGEPFPTPPIANVPGAPGYKPPGIWGPTDPRPTHPIVLPPQTPGGPPVVIWPNPPEGSAPLPEHPIVLPGDPSWGPPPDIGPQPPEPVPPGCKWGYTEKGWVLVCGPYPGGKPRPPG